MNTINKNSSVNKKGKMFILSGPSGVGKTTVTNILLSNKSLNLRFSISITTRQPRANEKNHQHYNFVTREQFKKYIKNNELYEHIEFVGNYYGTHKAHCEEILNAGKNLFLEIDVEGCKNIYRQKPDAILIFLRPPSFKILKARIVNRQTESETSIQKRLEKFESELKSQNIYKYKVICHNPQQAVDEIATIIKNETMNNDK